MKCSNGGSTMKCSESIVRLAASLAKAQGEMENAAKRSVNPHFKSKYADLAEIVNTARPVLTRHGISLIQIPSYDGQVALVETVLLHESGEWISGVSSSSLQKADPQGIGSATTYLRRYAVAAFCFLAQENDDANAATHGQNRQPKSEPKATKAQVRKITQLMGMDENDALSHVHDILNAVKPIAKFKSFGCVTSRMADYVINDLEALMRDAQAQEQAEAEADARVEERAIENSNILKGGQNESK